MTAWVRDLLGLWAHRDERAAAQNLGYPSVACGFGLTSEDADEAEDPVGYSLAEIEAMAGAVMWLATAHPDHWRALSREFRPWTRRTLKAMPGDAELCAAGMEMLGQHINKKLG